MITPKSFSVEYDFESNPPEIISVLKNRNADLYNQVKNVFYDIKDALDIRIAQVFESYTLHNTQHSFRIMSYMGQLVQDINLLTDLEIAMLVYSALLHDIGMAASKDEIDSIVKGNLIYQEIDYKSP
ncbi:HD domain-containing protein [Priestia sp. OVL9]|nr:HD domain-containing protein [Priestia sp. OVL9]